MTGAGPGRQALDGTATTAAAKRFDAPDEVRPFTNHRPFDLVQLTTGPVSAGTFDQHTGVQLG